MKRFELNILRLLLVKICWNKGNNCCFMHCFKNLSCWHAFRHLQFNLIKLGMMRHFDTSLGDLALDWRSQEYEKATTSVPVISLFSIDLNGIWFTVETRLCDEPPTLYFVHLISKGVNRTYVISWKKNPWNFDLYSDIYGPISFKIAMVIETTMLYISISVWMTLIFIQGNCCMRNQKLCRDANFRLFSVFFCYFWPYFIFLFLNFLSLFGVHFLWDGTHT